MLIVEYQQGTVLKKIRQGLALPFYIVALIISYASDLLANLSAVQHRRAAVHPRGAKSNDEQAALGWVFRPGAILHLIC